MGISKKNSHNDRAVYGEWQSKEVLAVLELFRTERGRTRTVLGYDMSVSPCGVLFV